MTGTAATPRRERTPGWGGLALALLMLGAGCRSDELGPAAHGPELGFISEDDELADQIDVSTTVPVTTSTTTTEPIPVPIGSAEAPFAPLPPEAQPRVVRTPSGIALPVLGQSSDSWRVMTACEKESLVDKVMVTPVDRAHVVIDAGHGGTEVGAVGPAGTREKDVNLAVALAAAERLRAEGAQVLLTRSGDTNATVRFRGQLAASMEPGLFVSVHHNGGANPSGDRPGTIVFTKADNSESGRFGRLFFNHQTAEASRWAEAGQQAYRSYQAELAAYEAGVDAYDQSVRNRDAALLANGQITETTSPAPAATSADGQLLARQRNPIPTTTRPVPTSIVVGTVATNPDDPGPPLTTTSVVTRPTVPVPETLPVPPPFDRTPVRPFRFAGGTNSGVRSWVDDDGVDYLSVIRNSADVPAALAEFLFITNPSEEQLLMDDAYLDAQGEVLARSITDFFAGEGRQLPPADHMVGDQPTGGGGRPSQCSEPDYGWD